MQNQYTCLNLDSPDDYLRWADSFVETQLFALVDVQSPLTRLDEIESGRWGTSINLYGDLEGTEIAQFGPRIVKADGAVNRQTLVEYAFSTRASLLLGRCTLAEVAKHLQDQREVTLPGGTPALFRYQDGHVTAALFPTLKLAQGHKLLGPLTAWATLDACHHLHVLSSVEKKRVSGTLRFDKKTVDAIDEHLFVHTVTEQVRETDSALLGDMNACQIETRIRRHIEQAKTLGLNQRADQSLYCVLSFQFPAGFENEPPFVSAIRYRDGRHASFGDALDAVPSKAWDVWDKQLAEDQ